jgi:2-phospho-L-lactate guanylyltransferase
MWSVVIPVKGTSNSKSRFGSGDNSGLAIAMALDTVRAAVAADGVDEVIVVTSAGEPFLHTGAIVVADRLADTLVGLSAAIEVGLAAVGVRRNAQPGNRAGSPNQAQPGDLALERNRAVLLGDVPGLRPRELSLALTAALRHPLSMVADSDGTGTTLATATSGHPHMLAFGPGSREAHIAAGYEELSGEWPGLTRDVDNRSHLDFLARTGMLGEHTSAYCQLNAPT